MILRSVFVCFRSLNHNDKVLMMWRLTRQVRITSITTLFKTAYLVAKFSVPKIHAKFKRRVNCLTFSGYLFD